MTMLKSASKVKDQLLKLACDIQDIERVNVWDLKDILKDFRSRYSNIVFSMDYLRRERKCGDVMFLYLVERLENVTEELDLIRRNVKQNEQANFRVQTEAVLLIRKLSSHPNTETQDSVSKLMDHLLDNDHIAWDDITLDLLEQLGNLSFEVKHAHPL